MPFIKMIYDKIEKIWGKGFIIVKSIKETKNVASYVCKYMTKSKADERLCGQKSYFTSNGLKKPMEYKDEIRIQNILKLIPESAKPYKFNIKNSFCGKILYRRYDLTDYKNEKEILYDFLELRLL